MSSVTSGRSICGNENQIFYLYGLKIYLQTFHFDIEHVLVKKKYEIKH